jgi:hypothetical protein
VVYQRETQLYLTESEKNWRFSSHV